MPRKLGLGILAGLLTLLATGCIVSMEPRTAVNPVGTDHTVTVVLEEPDITPDEFNEFLCDLFQELFPGEIGEPCLVDAVLPTDHVQDYFEVIDGPNEGTRSDNEDIEVDETGDQIIVSWTYTSNGQAGRDLIRFCDISQLQSIEGLYREYVEVAEEVEFTEEEFFQFFVDFFNEELGTDYDDLDDMLCETVSKTWVAKQQPNLGAGLSGLFQGQPTALPTAAAPAAPATVIRPPSTGDAGLVE